MSNTDGTGKESRSEIARNESVMKEYVSKVVLFTVSVLMMAVAAISTVTALAYPVTALASGGQCKWEGGLGVAPSCKAEDCIGDGGLARCSAAEPAAPPSFTDAELGPDKWVISFCRDGLPSLPGEYQWCIAAGGTLVAEGVGFRCDGLPPNALHNNETLSAREEDVLQRTRAYMYTPNCSITLALDTGWGATLDPGSCTGGGTVYTMGLPTRSVRHIVWNRGSPCNPSGHSFSLSRGRAAICPSGYKQRNSVSGPQCYAPAECCEARVGNPVSAISGAKLQREVDYQPTVSGGLELVRHYNSSGYFRFPNLGVLPASLEGMVVGDYWHHNYDTHLYPVTSNGEVMAIEQRADGTLRVFDLAGHEVGNTDGGAARLRAASGGYEIKLANSDVHRYNASGQLASIVTRAGMTTTLTYVGALLDTVTDAFGHSLTFAYTDGVLTSVTLPDGGIIQYGYDAIRRPVSVTYPDTSTRQYVYGEPTRPWLLTAIVDENNQTFAKYVYNTAGAVTSESHASDAGDVEQYFFIYNAASTTVTDPLGAETEYSFSPAAGSYRKIAHSQRCLSCSAFATRSFDAQGNLASMTDYNGNQTVYSFDPVRNLEVSRTEAFGSAVARTILTQWHPTYRLPTEIEEPGRRTAYTHDADGNVLTRTLTDTATSASRTWTYTYNSYGQVLTVDGPRSDVSDVTTMTYHNCARGYECGQLATVTDAVGNETNYLTYNAHGQPLTISDANGVVTTLTYDARQRLTARDVAGENVSFGYYPTGQLKRVTMPDSSYLEYAYDAAHRLTSIEDGAGNRIAYRLNAAGQRTIESVYDPSNVLARTQGSVYDALGRVLSTMDAYNYSTSYTYDQNGNVETLTDSDLRVTTHSYDALNRQRSLVDSMNGLIEYSYSPLDQLEEVTDPRALPTNYQYNGLGDQVSLTSPDTGVTAYTKTASGRTHQATDARGQVATYSYDAAERIAQVAYSDQTIRFTYDQGTYGKGRLTHLTDASGATHWTYDAQGRVASKQQTAASINLTVGYGHNSVGQLSQITTPSGQLIGYSYDNGRISAITVNGSSLLSGVLYTPFGPTRGWNWGNGTLAVREYDLNGRVSMIDSGGLSSYEYYPDGTIQSWSQDGTDSAPGSSGITEFDVDINSNRLTASNGLDVRSYTYDAMGNILSDGVRSFTYNGAGRMVTATNGNATATYAVNGLGQRVRKTVSGQTRLFVYNEQGQLLGEYTGVGGLVQETVWLDDVPVAVLKPSGSGVSVYYIHSDHLNTPRSITRTSDNAAVWRWTSDPFGATLANEDPDGDSVAFSYGLRFPGQYFDSEVGLHYNYYRDYDPATGRYVQSDPIGLDGGINSYTYVGGNPLGEFDIRGLAGSKNGGPWHPPLGLKTKCRPSDSCPRLEQKIYILTRMAYSHIGWDASLPPPRGGTRHATEIDDILKQLTECEALLLKCRARCPPPPPPRRLPLPRSNVLLPFIIWDMLNEMCASGHVDACLATGSPPPAPIA